MLKDRGSCYSDISDIMLGHGVDKDKSSKLCILIFWKCTYCTLKQKCYSSFTGDFMNKGYYKHKKTV